MIDEAIEEHLRELISEAYPALSDDQVLIQFPSASLDLATGHRRAPGGGHIIGSETVEAHVVIGTEEKIDRIPLVRLLRRRNMVISKTGSTEEWNVLQEYQRCEQKDYVEAIKMKGVLFVINYIHEVS